MTEFCLEKFKSGWLAKDRISNLYKYLDENADYISLRHEKGVFPNSERRWKNGLYRNDGITMEEDLVEMIPAEPEYEEKTFWVNVYRYRDRDSGLDLIYVGQPMYLSREDAKKSCASLSKFLDTVEIKVKVPNTVEIKVKVPK